MPRMYHKPATLGAQTARAQREGKVARCSHGLSVHKACMPCLYETARTLTLIRQRAALRRMGAGA